METLAEIVGFLNGWLWSKGMIALCLFVGIQYSIVMRWPQIRLFRPMVQSIRGGDSSAGITPFQAFTMALGGRVGVGAIAGVATGIYFGGPGAVFWLMMYSILGSATAMGESVLAQIWKVDVAGEYRGGPAYYLKQSPLPIMGTLSMIAGILSFGFTAPTIQAYNIAESMQNAFGVNVWVSGVIQAILFGVIVLGGMRRIGQVAEYVVPFMAIAYLILTVIVLAVNIVHIPAMIYHIFASAFALDAVYGAIFGSAIMWGVRRAVYSSEAGMGSGAHAAAAAEVPHPIQQGLAQGFSVYLTLIICLCTALMIMSTGMFNTINENIDYEKQITTVVGAKDVTKEKAIEEVTKVIQSSSAFKEKDKLIGEIVSVIETGFDNPETKAKTLTVIGDIVKNSDKVVINSTNEILHSGIPNVQQGIGYTQAAIDSLVYGKAAADPNVISFGSYFIALAVLFFAFTTILSFGFYAEVNVSYLLRNSPLLKTAIITVVCIQMASIVLGSVVKSGLAWDIADLGVALITWSNLIGMVFLSGVCAKCMRHYDDQKKKGLKPVFNPDEAGIKNAELWHSIVEKNYKDLNQDKS